MSLLVLFLSSGWAQATEGDGDEFLNLYYGGADMVESATRGATPLDRVVENVTVITAAEIKRMNAHYLAQVLDRVPGLFVSFYGHDYMSTASLSIQGSSYHQVLVLVDGVRWNFAYSGFADTSTIPVEIIERIEVIKGPASSTWGSAMGGVINVITKKATAAKELTGQVSASLAQAESHSLVGQANGQLGKVGYFVHGAEKETDGIDNNRFWHDKNVYGKVTALLPAASRLTFTGGYSSPELNYGDVSYSAGSLGRFTANPRDGFGTAIFDTIFADKFSFNISGHYHKKKYRSQYTNLSTKTIYAESYNDEETSGFTSKLVFQGQQQQAIIGFDFDRSKIMTQASAEYYEEGWGLYANDTISFGDFTVVPGARYDAFSISEDMVSPSLGVVWNFTDSSLLRATAGQGFKKPIWANGLNSNPGLRPEKVTSYQLGLESRVLKFATIRAQIFHHNVRDGWKLNNSYVYENKEKLRRYGGEMELATLAFHGVSAVLNGSYVCSDYPTSPNIDTYNGNLIVRYDNPQVVEVELAGHFLWERENGGEEGSIIWDLNLNRNFSLGEETSFDLFATGHNLTNDSQYFYSYYENPSRWFEAGVRIFF